MDTLYSETSRKPHISITEGPLDSKHTRSHTVPFYRIWALLKTVKQAQGTNKVVEGLNMYN